MCRRFLTEGAMKMDKEKLLDKYISERFPDCFPFTEEERKYIADTAGFQAYCLHVAFEELKAELKHCFPFNLLFTKERQDS